MAYDWEKDLQPITLLVKVPNVLAVNMDVPAKSVPEQYREFIKNESAKFAKIIVEAGVKLEQ